MPKEVPYIMVFVGIMLAFFLSLEMADAEFERLDRVNQETMHHG